MSFKIVPAVKDFYVNFFVIIPDISVTFTTLTFNEITTHAFNNLDNVKICSDRPSDIHGDDTIYINNKLIERMRQNTENYVRISTMLCNQLSNYRNPMFLADRLQSISDDPNRQHFLQQFIPNLYDILTPTTINYMTPQYGPFLDINVYNWYADCTTRTYYRNKYLKYKKKYNILKNSKLI